MASTSCDKDELNQVFKGRDGTTNDGKEYEWSLLAYYGILLLNPNIKEAWIATEPDECGDFDDVIIYWKADKTNDEEMILVQCKHSNNKKTIKTQQFLNGKDKDFFLGKYIKSYNNKIGSCFASKPSSIICKTLSRLAGKFKCVLLTNNDANAADILEETKDHSLSFFNIGGNVLAIGGNVHRFKTENLSTLIVTKTLDQIIEKNKLFNIISEIPLNEIILIDHAYKKIADIKMEPVILKKELNEIINQVRSKQIPEQKYSKEELITVILEELNGVISNTTLKTIISEIELNKIIAEEGLEKSITKAKLNQVLCERKLSSIISKAAQKEIISKEFELNFDFIDKKLFLFSNQVHNDNVVTIIAEKLSKMSALNNVFAIDFDSIVRNYMSFIRDWARRKLDGSYVLTKTHIIRKITELMLEPYMSQLYKYNFNTSAISGIRKWHSIIEGKEIILVNVAPNDAKSITPFLCCYLRSKVFQYNLERFFNGNWQEMFKNETKDILLKQEMLRTIRKNEKPTLFHIHAVMWKCEGIPLVLEIDSSHDYKNILHILELGTCKLRVIIINTNDDHLYTDQIPQHFQDLSDLDGHSKQLVLEGTVNLQGRTMQMNTLITKYKRLSKLVKTRDIIYTFTKQFDVGNMPKQLPKYFIKRSITPTFLDIQLIVKALDYFLDVYVIYGVNKKTFYKYLKHLQLQIDESVLVDSFQIKQPNQIMKKYKIITIEYQFITRDFITTEFQEKNIHFLIFHDENHSLQWIGTLGSTAFIRPFRLEPKPDYSMANLNIGKQLMYLKNPLTVISANPGMGKSVMMDHIACNTSTNFWILQVNLAQYTKYYRAKIFKEAHDHPSKHLEYFNNKILTKQNRNDRLNREAFTQFLNSNSLLVILDGFDEISPNYKEEVSAMIAALLKKKYRLVITTRPVLQRYLEREFDVIAVTLNPFTADDQNNFLKEYFKTALNIPADREVVLQNFVKKLLRLAQKNLNDWEQEFTGVPLQTELLANVFEDSCKNYLADENYTLQETFDLLYLYETFVERKIEILNEKFKGHIDFKSFEIFQQIYALKVLFLDDDLKGLEIDKKIAHLFSAIGNAIESLQKNGFMVSQDEVNLTFIHRTFAEYFAAKWLFQNMQKAEAKILIKIIFKPDYIVTRNIFDRLLATTDLHKAIINQNVDKVRDIIKRDPTLLNIPDRGGRFPIHLMAAWSTRHPMPKQRGVIDANFNKIEAVSDAMEKLLGKLCHDKEELHLDDVLEYSPIDYAVASDSLSSLNSIISNLNFSPTISLGRINIKDYIYYSSRYGYTSLIKRILQKFNSKQISQNFNSPLDITYNRTALQWASIGGYRDTVELFFSDQIDGDAIQRKNFVESLVSKTDIDGKTALHLAAENNHPKLVAIFLSQGANVEIRDKHGYSALHLAAENGGNPSLEVLIQSKVNVDLLDSNNNTPLHIAAFEGHKDTVLLLLNWNADAELQNRDGRTALHMATIKGCIETMHIMLEHANQIINTGDGNGNTALHLSADHGYQTAAKLLLSKNANPNVKNNQGNEALHLAAANGYTKIVTLLLSKTNINIANENGDTPLHLASVHNHPTTVSELLKKNASINQRNSKGRTALHEAIRNNCEQCLTVLFEGDANLHEKDEYDRTVLHLAAIGGNIKTLSLLLQKRMDVNDKDRHGDAPLHLAAANQQTDMVTLLLSANADPTAENKNKSTPLHIAVASGHEETVNVLLSTAINVDARNKQGKTALHIASENGDSGIVNLLLEKGADTNVVDENGYNAIILAEVNGHANLFYSAEDEIVI